MGDIPIELLKTFPIAGALIYMVIIFLRALDKRAELIKDVQKEWSGALKDITEKTNTTVERNTEALILVKSVIDKCKMRNE